MIVEALDDKDTAVQQCAALALREHPQAAAVPKLLNLLSAKDALLARLAGDALVAAGEIATSELLTYLETNETSGKREAVRALALIGDRRAIGALFDLIDGDSVLADYWAALGLDRMGIGMAFFDPSKG